MKPDPPVTRRGPVHPSLLTSHWNGREETQPWDCWVCSRHCSDELWSPAQERSKCAALSDCLVSLSFLELLLGSPTRHADRSHLLWQEQEGFAACLASVYQMRGNKISAHLWLSRCVWLHSTTIHTCCYLTSGYIYDSTTYFNCQTFSWAYKAFSHVGKLRDSSVNIPAVQASGYISICQNSRSL